MILSMYFKVKMTVKRYYVYQSVSVAVGEKLPCQRDGANSDDPFAVAVMTSEVIIGHKKCLQFAQCYLGQFFVDLLDLRLEDTVLDLLSA